MTEAYDLVVDITSGAAPASDKIMAGDNSACLSRTRDKDPEASRVRTHTARRREREWKGGRGRLVNKLPQEDTYTSAAGLSSGCLYWVRHCNAPRRLDVDSLLRQAWFGMRTAFEETDGRHTVRLRWTAQRQTTHPSDFDTLPERW